LSQSVKLVELARRPQLALDALFAAAGVGQGLSREALITADLEIKYAGYFERERLQAGKLRRMGELRLDAALPYADMRSLSFEARQKLAALKPATLAQAAGVPGVSPSDIQNLVIEIERRSSVR
jgi:tRNA uridine 5-carboxymethylaminomethyl modification enzyme